MCRVLKCVKYVATEQEQRWRVTACETTNGDRTWDQLSNGTSDERD